MIPSHRVAQVNGNYILKPRFRLGVEFEGAVLAEAFAEFRSHLIALGGTDDEGAPRIFFGTDGSVQGFTPEHNTVEIRTAILPYYAGRALFEDMLCYLWLAAQEGVWSANDTCGLHINVSEVDTFRRGSQVKWYCHVASRFDEANILKRFGREGSKYCRPIFGPKDSRDISAIGTRFQIARAPNTAPAAGLNGDKYLSVALRSSPNHGGYQGSFEQYQRVEFRCLGGKDYQLKLDDIREAMDHIHEVIKGAYRDTAPTLSSADIS